MIYFVCAFKAEARPFIDRLRLSRTQERPLIYRGDDAILIVGGMGAKAAADATRTVMELRPPAEEDLLVNLGICAAPARFAVGTLLAPASLRCGPEEMPLPSLRKTTLPRIALRTVDRPCDEPAETAVDMEAFAVAETAAAFFPEERIAVLKIVSDHFEPDSVTPKLAERLIEKQAENILKHLRFMLH